MRCAIFCNVIDNFGDIGVCWRLARQLAAEYQLKVSLFVDDLNSFAVLAPPLQAELPVQLLGQITVHHWHTDVRLEQAYEIIIEGFGCRLSDQLMDQMQQQAIAGQPPVWLNLEYMSAESWVMDCHGMTSIHPATGLKQIFWFPSTTVQSGGLIREQSLLAERDQFQQDSQQQSCFWQSLNVPEAPRFPRKISLFSYENDCTADLLTALAEDSTASLLLVPKSKSIADIQRWLHDHAVGRQLEAGDQLSYQNLTIAVLPFLSYGQYDQLLWGCDLNFVRGEDSCVRAQWAARPFVWHIYPQDENAHLIKLQAWMDQVDQQAKLRGSNHLSSWHLAMQAWNNNAASSPELWQQLLADLPQWRSPITAWSNYLSGQPDLATRLMGLFQPNQLQ